MKSTFNNPVQAFIGKQGFLMLDGGLASEMEFRGADLRDPLWSARMLLENPDLIFEVGMDFLLAGADIVTSASYQASIPGLMKKGFSRKEAKNIISKSVEIAVRTRDKFWESPSNRVNRIKPLVVASVGPYGAYLANGAEYTGKYEVSKEALIEFHSDRLDILSDSGADLIAFETIPNGVEANAIAGMLSNFPGMASWMSLSCRDAERLVDGTSIRDLKSAISSQVRIVAIGVNCLAPDLAEGALKTMSKYFSLPLVVYPNSGEVWNAKDHCWMPGKAEQELTELTGKWYAAGARLIGGCCRTRPEDIRQMRKQLDLLPELKKA